MRGLVLRPLMPAAHHLFPPAPVAATRANVNPGVEGAPPHGFTGFAVGSRERQKVQAERVKRAHLASESLAADIDQVLAVDEEAANVNAGVEGAPLPSRVLMPAAHRLFSAQDPAAPRCMRRLTSVGRPPAVPPLVQLSRCGRVLMRAAHRLFSAQEPAAPRCTRRLTSLGRPPGVPPPVRVWSCAHARSSPPLLRAGAGGAGLHAAPDERGEAAAGAGY